MAQKTTIERLTRASAVEKLAEYHAFVDSSPQGIMYSKAWWLEAVAPGRWEVLTLRTAESIRAAWALVYNPARDAVVMPQLTQKLGVMYAPSEARYSKQIGDEISACNELLDAIPADMPVDQMFHENFTNWLAFLWRDFEQTTRYTYVFDDLQNVGQYMERMTNDCRQRVGGAQKELKVVETEDLRKMYDVNSLTFNRQGLNCPFTFDLVERIHNACRANAGARILLAEDTNGEIHACDYMVYDRRVAVSIIQGADPRFRKGGAQRLLDWESINFAAQHSARFDFEGSIIPGVEPYVRGFGAKQLPYFHIHRGGKSRYSGLPMRAFVAKALRALASRIDPH